MISLSNVLFDVANALREDLGEGDVTAELLPIEKQVCATIIARESLVVCGTAWALQSFKSIDSTIAVEFFYNDGDVAKEGATLCRMKGNARAILTAERVALNFLQLLSATSTKTRDYVNRIKHTRAQILDTRKTLPGLRYAQKYAVKCGGGRNHRMGLFDAFLIKENHIKACGSIQEAVLLAKSKHSDKVIEVEVETLEEFQEALLVKPGVIMLDNFSLKNLQQAVNLKKENKVKLEASGGISVQTIKDIAETGVDYISIGDITKSISAIDLSLLVEG